MPPPAASPDLLPDSAPLLREPHRLRERADQDGCLLLRATAALDTVLAMQRAAVQSAVRRAWLDERDPSQPLARPRQQTPLFSDPALHAFQSETLASPEFQALRTDPAILAAVSAVLGAPAVPIRRDSCRVIFPHSAERTTRPHQDAYFLRSGIETWTVWVPLTDCPRALGPLQVIRASHKGGLRQHSGPGPGYESAALWDDDTWSSVDFHVGDILLIHSLTVHAGLPNTDPRRCRLSADFRYQRALQPEE